MRDPSSDAPDHEGWVARISLNPSPPEALAKRGAFSAVGSSSFVGARPDASTRRCVLKLNRGKHRPYQNHHQQQQQQHQQANTEIELAYTLFLCLNDMCGACGALCVSLRYAALRGRWLLYHRPVPGGAMAPGAEGAWDLSAVELLLGVYDKYGPPGEQWGVALKLREPVPVAPGSQAMVGLFNRNFLMIH